MTQTALRYERKIRDKKEDDKSKGSMEENGVSHKRADQKKTNFLNSRFD